MIYVLLSLALTALYAVCAFNRNKFTTIFGSVVLFIFWSVINYFAMPTVAFWSGTLWFEVFLTLLCGWGTTMFTEEDPGEAVWTPKTAVMSGVLGVYLIAWIAMGIASSEMVNASDYNQMLDVEEVKFDNFSQDIDVIPVSKMIVVDDTLAKKLVEDRLEEDPGLGSRCEVGRMTLQNLTGSFTINGGKTLTFNNEQIWVAPLEHSGFWKWVANDVTPGYMLIYANDPTKTYLITEVNGKPLKMRYIESAAFGDDIERHIRNNGYLTQGVTEHNFEIDANGNPYWVLCNYEPTIGLFFGDDAKGVITVDIQTGAVEQYSIEDAPAWVDHIQPQQFVFEQVYNWGEYKKGWWNACWAQVDVQLPTPGMVLVYSNGESYWYTGVRSAGGDSATSGFMLVNSRTKKAKYYKVAGVNELEAQKIVEDQNFAKMAKYKATSPVLYNVRGVPTYFMTLKGESGNITGYAFMAVTNRQAVGVGSSKREAENKYLQALMRTSNDKIVDGAVEVAETKIFVVKDITNEGNVYYILFDGVKGKEFTGTSEFFRELKWTKPGHKVEVSYAEGQGVSVQLDTFENVNVEI